MEAGPYRGGQDVGREKGGLSWRSAPWTPVLRVGRDVLVEPEQVVGVVGGLHRRQPLPRRAGVRRVDALRALVGEQARVGSGVAVVQLGGEPAGPRGVAGALGG